MNGSPVRARVRSLGCWGPDVRAQGGLLAQRQEVQEDEPGRVHTVLDHGVEVVKIDLTQPLGPQGPFDIILHKLSDVIVEAEHDSQSQQLLDNFQSYVSAHPDTVLLDPLPAMAKLLDRFVSCRIMSQLNSSLRGDCSFSAQRSFVNHGAVLYKVFVVGDKHCCVERPSIKNFPSGPCDRRTIFFNSQKVSKPESNSDLTSVDEHMVDPPSPSSDAVAALVKELRAQLGMALFGVDVIINIGTHALTVIDINIFPGYEGMPQFFSSLLSHIQSVLDKHAAAGSHTTGGSSEETVGVCHPRS
ncbi:unnamed protein product [Oreochromis niloticus]|nr:unnamed protein product [Mustela putorius furo]